MREIRILVDHFYVGNRAVKKGETVQVAEIGEPSAKELIRRGRAEAVKAGEPREEDKPVPDTGAVKTGTRREREAESG